MYKIETKINKIKMNDLILNYRNMEKIEGYCKECSKYNMVWSCPPYDFNIENYLSQFENVHIIGTKVIFDKEVLATNYSKEEVNKISFETVINVRKKVFDKLIKLEEIYPEGKIINSGNCTICNSCTRISSIKCIHERDLRYSLESLGFDVGKVTKEILNIELKWPTHTRLPEYLTLASGFMTNLQIENSEINNLLTNL
ncbi:MAG: hypothetical protein K0Q97_1513 [Bacillota bacterium]|nr:hypothetical protein [Bacillota bacterium]